MFFGEKKTEGRRLLCRRASSDCDLVLYTNDGTKYGICEEKISKMW